MRERQNELRSITRARGPEPEAEDTAAPAPRRQRPAAPQSPSATADPARLQPDNSASFARTLAAASIAQQAEPAAPRPRTVAPATSDEAERLRALSERLNAAQEPAR